MRRKRLCAAISAAVMCVSMLGNVPMMSMAQESARTGVEAEIETDTNVKCQQSVY